MSQSIVSLAQLVGIVAIVATAVVAPSAALATDTTPPREPSPASLALDPSTYRMSLHWRVPVDNVDAPEDLRYRVFDCGGRPLDFNGTRAGTDFAPTATDGASARLARRYTGGPGPVTIAAVDRAGNVSEPAIIRFETWIPTQEWLPASLC
jgi:hypothetical protein